jgi:hypothetical protein
MGTWGTGIFSDDNAADLRDDYRDFIGDGLSGPEATDRLLAEWGSSISREPEYAATFWLALAVTQWLAGKFERKRKSVLDAVRQQIESSQPPPRKIPKRVRAVCEWEPTELIGYRLLSGDYIILRVIHLVSDKGGVYPDCEPLDWQGKEFPPREIIDDLPIRPRLPGTYGLHSVIMILPAGKRRPDDRIVRLNIKRLAGTPRPVASTVMTWKNLDQRLEFLFGFR